MELLSRLNITRHIDCLVQGLGLRYELRNISYN